jgi:hypothetical protein
LLERCAHLVRRDKTINARKDFQDCAFGHGGYGLSQISYTSVMPCFCKQSEFLLLQFIPNCDFAKISRARKITKNNINLLFPSRYDFGFGELMKNCALVPKGNLFGPTFSLVDSLHAQSSRKRGLTALITLALRASLASCEHGESPQISHYQSLENICSRQRK